ncbi:MAG TPA: serine/threonine-protein kinase [Trichormus sp.]
MEEQKKQPKIDVRETDDLRLSPPAEPSKDTTVDRESAQAEGAEPGNAAKADLFDDIDLDMEDDQLARAQRLADEHKCVGGRYTILELLGMGAVGSVYKVKHELLGKIFALKMLNPNVSAEFKVIQRFHLEAKAVAELSHPNLISVHDFGVTEDGAPYLVMDYLEGTSLDKEIEQAGHLDENRVISLFLKVCEGLSYAHKKGIIHRDLKPSNIMLVKDEHGKEIPKIVDFGIAKRTAVDTKLTQTGEVFGTPLYMSPEQCLGNAVDARSDIYSLGCIMYECLSGKEAYAAANIIQTIFRHVNEDAKPLRKVCEGFEVSSAIEQVVTSCLERDPAQRPATADGLSVNLDRIAHGKAPVNVRKLPKIKRAFVHNTALVVTTLVLTLLAFIYFGLWMPTDYMATIGQAANEDARGNYTQALVLAQKAIAQANAKGASAPAKDLMILHQFAAAYAVKLNDSKLTASEDMEASRLAEITGNKAAASHFANSGARFEDAVNKRAAQPYYRRAVALYSEQLGNDSPGLVDVLLRAAESAQRCNTDDDMKACLSYIEKAAQIVQRNDKASQLPVGVKFRVYRCLGQAYAHFDRFADADKAFTLSLSAAKEAHLDAGDTTQWQAYVQKKLKAKPDARSTSR